MHSAAAGHLAWRFDLYRNVRGFCDRGGYTLPRFMALAPDRLRPTAGESVAKTRIVVALSDSWVQALAEGVRQTGPASETFRLEESDTLRRVLALCQTDSGLEPTSVVAWVERGADRLVHAVSAIHQKALREVGQGGGEEAAYLTHLVALDRIRRELDEQSEPQPWRALICSVLGSELEALAGSDAATDALSARLGLQLAVATSVPALGARRKAILSSRVNAYRTVSEVVAKVEETAYDPFDAVADDRFLEQLEQAVASDRKARIALGEAALLELVRDCLLLAVLRGHPDERLGERLAAGNLDANLFNAWQRDELELVLADGGDEEPFVTLRALVGIADVVSTGDVEPLANHLDFSQCVRLAVRGAIVLALDERAVRLERQLSSTVEYLEGEVAESAWKDGRAFWVGEDDRPAYLISPERKEAHLFVDVGEFTRRTARIKERAMGDFLRRYFYDPILAKAAGRTAPLEVSNIIGDAVAFRGDIVAMVELALEIRQILETAHRELQRELPDFLGGAGRVREIEQEMKQLSEELESLARSKGSEVDARTKHIAAQLSLLEESRRQELARSVGEGLEAGAYVSWGPAGETFEVSHPSLGSWSVTIASGLNEAARGAVRKAGARQQRIDLMLRARAQGADRELPFKVTVHEGEIYNAGSVLSSAALAAFQAAREGVFEFAEVELRPEDAPDHMRAYIFEREVERFQIVRGIGDTVVHLFRYSGTATFRGLEARGEVELWELLLPDSDFGRDLLACIDD